MKQVYGKQVSETNICNSSGYWLNPLTEKTQPKLILTLESLNLGGSCFKATLGKQFMRPPISKTTGAKWNGGLSSRVPALQMWSPEFKPQSLTHTHTKGWGHGSSGWVRNHSTRGAAQVLEHLLLSAKPWVQTPVQSQNKTKTKLK
jgi:hypothetical protein